MGKVKGQIMQRSLIQVSFWAALFLLSFIFIACPRREARPLHFEGEVQSGARDIDGDDEESSSQMDLEEPSPNTGMTIDSSRPRNSTENSENSADEPVNKLEGEESGENEAPEEDNEEAVIPEDRDDSPEDFK